MNDLLKLLYKAYRAEFGIIVATDNPELLRQRLYKLRKGDPDLATLSILTSPLNAKDLWIAHERRPTETYTPSI